ncbi:hypothetical protein D3C79_936370 [compost metagenome]
MTRIIETNSLLRSTFAATGAMNSAVIRANSPDTDMPIPAWPSVRRKSVATGVSRLTGMNSDATRANAAKDMAITAPQALGLSP